MKQGIFLFFSFFLIQFTSNAQNTFLQDSLSIEKLKNYSLENSVCYEDLRILCKQIGHRISGSKAAEKAVEWGVKTLKSTGCDKVYLQTVMVPHWVRGLEEFSVTTTSNEHLKFNALGLGNSIGTEEKPLTAQIIEVKNMEQLEMLGEENIYGKIVFFNHPWDQHCVNPFKEYGNSVYYRWAGPSKAAQFGAVGVIIRSAGSGYDDFAHTGSMRYDSLYKKIPAMAISYNEALKLEKICRSKQAKNATMRSGSHFEEDVLSYNVVGEITGSKLPNEIITVGGHLDSWDVGEGAHDDGAGCVQSIEVLRALVNSNIKPKRTIRCVLFMNEENGLRGGTEYARLAKEKKEKHIVAIETDAGGFSPRGFSATMDIKQRNKIKSWYDLFYPLGVYNFDEDGGGADIGPLHRDLGTPVMELLPDPQRYFDLHHTHLDVFEQVNRRELSLGAVAMSAMVYLISEHGL